MSINRIIGQNIKSDRKGTGLTQEKYAEMVGCSQKSVQHYEVGRVTPSVELLHNIAKKSGKTVDWFLNEHE